MSRIILWGFVLVALSVLCILNVTPVERRALNPADSISPTATTRPLQVQVTNFPATQNVGGTVNVGNLPLDGRGNLRVSGTFTVSQSAAHFVGYTAQATWMVSTPVLVLSRSCNVEFIGSRVCEQSEFLKSIPPPPAIQSPGGVGALTVYESTAPGSVNNRIQTICMSSDGELGACPSPGPYFVACCGY